MCEKSWETDKELLLFFTKWLTATYCEPGALPSECLQLDLFHRDLLPQAGRYTSIPEVFPALAGHPQPGTDGK